MPTIDIRIKDNIAMQTGGQAFIVRDNSNYVINFTFDVEWAEETAKTARFALQGGGYMDVPFTGSSVAVPVISTGRRVDVGVFAGNLRTTTSATLPLVPSIRSKGGAPVPPEDAVYDKLIALINSMGEISDDDIKQAVEDYLSANPIAAASMRVDGGYIQYSTDNGKTWVNLIAKADLKGDKGSTGADGAPGKDGADGSPGADGKSAYSYAVDGGYTGTEEEFAEKLAEEMPAALPNPNALTFTGAVDGSYDGSAPLSVEIPSGGGSGSDISLGLTGATVGQIAKITAVDASGVPTAWSPVDMPDALPNPNAITFTGAVTGSYDGSAPLSVEIPSGGGSSGGSTAEWQLLGTYTMLVSDKSLVIDLSQFGGNTHFRIIGNFPKCSEDCGSIYSYLGTAFNHINQPSQKQNVYAFNLLAECELVDGQLYGFIGTLDGWTLKLAASVVINTPRDSGKNTSFKIFYEKTVNDTTENTIQIWGY